MKTLVTVLCSAAAFVAVPAAAQDTFDTDRTTTSDGSRLFGFEPYVAVMGGWESFDNERNAGVPQPALADGRIDTRNRLDGSLVQGIVGANLPIGEFFVGAEGNVIKGISGNIDWQYGVAGRAGVRVGESGLFFGKAGYQWVNFDNVPAVTVPANPDLDRDYGDVTYGIGFEVGPQDIGLGGITGRSGLRLRGEVNTFGDFSSFRPMLGVVTHF